MDDSAYPHIVETIVQHASPELLHSFRLVSKRTKSYVDDLLVHVRVAMFAVSGEQRPRLRALYLTCRHWRQGPYRSDKLERRLARCDVPSS